MVVPASLRAQEGLPPRLAYPPFSSSGSGPAGIATGLAALLGKAALPARAALLGGAALPGPAPSGGGPGGGPAWAIEAAVLALLEGGAVVVPEAAGFRGLVSLSSWSMNVERRPTDGLLVQHLGIAGRMPPIFREGAAEALATLRGNDRARIEKAARERRRFARADGPVRFRRIAKKSAGLRPFVIYLDLFPACAAAGAARIEEIAGEEILPLLSMAAAIFI